MRAAIVARILGLDARTVRGYVRSGEWSGRIIGARVYVHRSVLHELRDSGEQLTVPR